MVFRLVGKAAVAAAVALMLACGGTPEAGQSCSTPNSGSCETTTAALVCINSKWTNVPCHGPNGCAADDSGQIVCDESLGVAGETCFTTTAGSAACATDGKAQLACSAGTFQKVSDCVTCNTTTTGQVDCQQPCGPDNCSGCCFNGACQTGNTAASCGKGGGTCTACENNQICRVDQSCGVDPDSMWKVQPTAATITPTNNGTDWDGDGSAPDVSVFLDCPPASTTTFDTQTPESASYSPTWTTGGCTAKASDLMAAMNGFNFQVFDIDVTSDDTITQGLAYQFKEADFVAGSVTLGDSGGMESLTFQLQKQ